MTEKITGYTLLAIGIIIMIFAAIQIIMVFTGKAQPIGIFTMEKDEPAPTKPAEQQAMSQEELMKKIQTGDYSSLLANSSGFGGLGIDATSINKMLNLTIYYLIMQFLLGLGYKLASLGVQMVRPLKIEVQRNSLASDTLPPA